MTVCLEDIYRIGPGPHLLDAVAPMAAAARFAAAARPGPGDLVEVALRGRLARVPLGRGPGRAVLLGLAGRDPRTVTAAEAPVLGAPVPAEGSVAGVRYRIRRDPAELPVVPDGLVIRLPLARGDGPAPGIVLHCRADGRVLSAGELAGRRPTAPPTALADAGELLDRARLAGSLAGAVAAAHAARTGDPDSAAAHLDDVSAVMRESVAAGLSRRVGPAGVSPRAPGLLDGLLRGAGAGGAGLDWVRLYALAVSEENAAGGRVVACGGNSCCGVLPAVLHHGLGGPAGPRREAAHEFLLAAAGAGAVWASAPEPERAAAMAAAGLATVHGAEPAAALAAARRAAAGVPAGAAAGDVAVRAIRTVAAPRAA